MRHFRRRNHWFIGQTMLLSRRMVMITIWLREHTIIRTSTSQWTQHRMRIRWWGSKMLIKLIWANWVRPIWTSIYKDHGISVINRDVKAKTTFAGQSILQSWLASLGRSSRACILAGRTIARQRKRCSAQRVHTHQLSTERPTSTTTSSQLVDLTSRIPFKVHSRPKTFIAPFKVH